MTRPSTRTAWIVAAPLTIAVVVSVVVVVRHEHDKGGNSPSAAPYPRFSAAFASAVNSTDVQILPASETAQVTEESAAKAALAQLPAKSSALAAELVRITNSQHPHGLLAWAIETDPAGGYQAPSDGPNGGKINAAPQRNFRVDFVDASTGTWLEGVQGYSPGL